jgi:hypothetical protein
VEVTAEGGVSAGVSLANLTLKDWGQDLPVPAGLTVAGFEVIDFTGANHQDGTIEGKGWMVLPMGGLVRVDRLRVSPTGKVLEGAWSGVLELGPLGEVTVAGGTITDDGLVGNTDLVVGPSVLQADFRLRSNGLLFGNAVGSLNLGGVPLANVNVSLVEDGSFAGTARAQIAGATSDSQIRLRLLTQPSARLTSVSSVGGASAQLDLQLSNAGATGTVTVDVFGQPVGFNVAILPGSGLTGSAVARLATPWGLAIDSNLQLDATGVHGSGRTRILGADFTASDLRLQSNGRLTGSFNGTLAVDGHQLGLTALEIRDDALQGRTTSVLGEVTGLVEFINQVGEASLVKVSQVNFRSTLAGLNSGLTELTVDALVAGQPQRFVIPYDLRTGQNEANLATAARQLSPQLYPDSAWTVLPWTNDGSSGITPGQTVWAYRFNSTGTTSVGSVPVIGLTGTSPAVSGRFSVQGFVAAYPGDQNVLTSGAGGSSVLAANFLFGANPGTITFEGLTPGVTYRATILSVGFDEAPVARNVTFSSTAGERTVEQNTYGKNQGIRIEHTFTATAATQAVTLTPATDATFHLYALRSNPQAANRSGFALPVPITLTGSVEARQFTVPYQPTSGDLVYRLRHSTNLGTWTDAFRLDLATGTITQRPGVSGTADATTRTVTVTITDLSLFAPPSFWRLSVEQP